MKCTICGGNEVWLLSGHQKIKLLKGTFDYFIPTSDNDEIRFPHLRCLLCGAEDKEIGLHIWNNRLGMVVVSEVDLELS